MARLPLGAIASILVMFIVFGFIATSFGTTDVHAGGSDDMEEDEEQETKQKSLFFILGIIVAVFLMSL